MSRGSADEVAREANLALVRQGAAVLALTAVLVVAGCGIAQGADGALGGLLGVLLVVLFFGVDAVVFLRPGASAPRSTTVVVMLYVLKLVVFALLVIGLAEAVEFDHGCFAVAVVVEALVAGAVAVRAFTRMRVPYVAP